MAPAAMGSSLILPTFLTRTRTGAKARAQLLPDFVQGWFLLQDANLETSEKNMILAALKGFSSARVAQELWNQWNDDDLRRDQGGRASAWTVDDLDDDPFAGDMESPDFSPLSTYGINHEDMALMNEAEVEAHAGGPSHAGERAPDFT